MKSFNIKGYSPKNANFPLYLLCRGFRLSEYRTGRFTALLAPRVNAWVRTETAKGRWRLSQLLRWLLLAIFDCRKSRRGSVCCRGCRGVRTRRAERGGSDGLASRGEPATERSEGAGETQGERCSHHGYSNGFLKKIRNCKRRWQLEKSNIIKKLQKKFEKYTWQKLYARLQW